MKDIEEEMFEEKSVVDTDWFDEIKAEAIKLVQNCDDQVKVVVNWRKVFLAFHNITSEDLENG